MPKGKRKGKFEHKRTEQVYSSDEDADIDMTIDNCSETSAQSDLKSLHDEPDPSEPDTRRRARLRRELKEPKIEEVTEIDANDTSGYYYDSCGRWTKRPPPPLPPNPSEPDTRRRARPQREPKPKNAQLQTVDEESDQERKKLGTVFNNQHFNNLFYDILITRRRWYGCGPQEAPPPQKTEIEKFEDKVLELIDNLEARAATARATAFVNLRTALQRRPLFHVIGPRHVTLASHVSKALKRGRDGERKAAAALAPLVALQIGEEGTEEFLNEIRPALVAAATDKTASVDTRAECCSSLAVICLLLEEDLTEIIEVMRMYETIFSGSYLKGDGSLKVSGSVIEEGSLHGAALDGWALLLSLLSDDHAADVLRNHPPSVARLGDLLEACSLDVRVAAGGALAIAHERVGGGELDALVEQLELVPRLQQLARDSHKYRAKRDRKLQRATFRDILKYFEEGETPSFTVRVGTECVECASWSLGAGYAALAGALGGGLQALATASPALRAALRLPDAPPPPPAPRRAQDKLQRHLQNTAACKARTVARGKNRDKRSAALAI